MKIDFVVTWLDANDPEWQKQYIHYKQQTSGRTESARFRNMDIFRYWFRSVEKYAPRKISYAASMGFLPIEKDISILKENLSFLDSISVRESNLLEVVSKIGCSARQDLDPTLLLTASRWKNYMGLKDIDKSYVLYYNTPRYI